MLKLRIAYQGLRDGAGSDEDFDQLAAALNTGMIRSEQIDASLMEQFAPAMRAMLEADRRNGTHGSYGFTGQELIAVNVAVETYEILLRASTPHQMMNAAVTGAERMRQGHVLTLS